MHVMKDFNIKNNLAESMEHLSTQQLKILITQTKSNIFILPPKIQIYANYLGILGLYDPMFANSF
jgi:hypothetical protein